MAVSKTPPSLRATERLEGKGGLGMLTVPAVTYYAMSLLGCPLHLESEMRVGRWAEGAESRQSSWKCEGNLREC